jgi:glycosyltransferase involved in cell wall biosynthesis
MTVRLPTRETQSAAALVVSHLTPNGVFETRLAKVVLVHSGARDAYQVSLAFSERGMLESFVTDLFWPSDRQFCASVSRRLPAQLQSLLKQRSEPRIPSSSVSLCGFVGLATLLLDKLPGVPMPLRRRVMRFADAALGRHAGRLARRSNANLLSYSYYAYDAFREYGRPGVLFQLHPHPGTMRRILTEELEANPDCASSLLQEWELSLSERDFNHLVMEPTMASHILVASSFTKASLVEHGISPSQISVLPYGVDLERFRPLEFQPKDQRTGLNLLFVGRINQRKGIKYLLQALQLLQRDDVHLTICGRVIDDLKLFDAFSSQVTVRPSVSADELVEAYQVSDLFVFPSVAEGFGQVLLEAMACGLPILSTTHTAAPDLIEHGLQGFIVEPRRPDLLAQHIAWAIDHRRELRCMGRRARLRAERFTWPHFRTRIADVVSEFLASETDKQEGRTADV